MTTDHIGDLSITRHAKGCTATLAGGVPVPGVYADTEAAVIASRLPMGLLADLAGRLEVIGEDDLEEAELGMAAEVEVDTETVMQEIGERESL